MFDILFAGHFAMDHKIIQGKEFHAQGGTVTFGSVAAAVYNPELKIGIISTVGSDFKPEYREFVESYGVDTRGVLDSGEVSTHYTLSYHNGKRDLFLSGRAPDLVIEQVPEEYFDTKAIMMGPICGEISNDFISQFVDRAPNAVVGLDAQGFIRSFAKDGKVLECSLPKKCDNIYTLIDELDDRLLFKASDSEATAISGKKDPLEAIDEIARNNAIIIVTLGPKGSLIKVPGDSEAIRIPAYRPQEVVDETGAGDAYMAGFLTGYLDSPRQREDVERSGLVGAATASFLIEQRNLRGLKSKDQIDARIENGDILQYPD